MTVTPVITQSPDVLYATISLSTSSAKTANGNGTTDSLPTVCKTLRLQLDVTASAGTNPTLDVVIEDTIDGTNYATIGTFTQKVTTGREVINITGLFARDIRARWTVGGTGGPSFTFSVTGVGRSLT